MILLILVLITVPFWSRTYQVFNENEEGGSISLLSYNAKLFRAPGTYGKFSMESIKWVVDDTSSIKCIQEYSTNAKWPSLDVTEQIEQKGYESHIYNANLKGADHNPGMATFSKYPIIDRGILKKSNQGPYAIIFSDIVIGMDTLRVYNVHLTSYNWGVAKKEHFIKKPTLVLKEVTQTVLEHSKEIAVLENHATKCPYPYLIAGDFNESPFSYNYQSLNYLNNAFEERGKGFGFTVIKLPLLLRIDHMFYDDEIHLKSFDVDYDMDVSDHYPITGSFTLSDETKY